MNGAAAAIGTFDGVHLGHEAVLACLRDVASRHGLTPVAVTFDRHPLALIAPERAPMAITTPEKKAELIRKAGVCPLVLPFDENLRSTTARGWMRRLHEEMGVTEIVAGYDNTFGCDGINLSIAGYAAIGRECGIGITEAPFIPGVSSSAIRKAIAAGDVEHAERMLGRPFCLNGIVVEGNRLGRTLGFPTANLLPEPGIIIPGNGVYAAMATLPDGKRHEAMVNIGTRPTVRRGDDRTVEAHILGYNGDLYGHHVALSFRARMRDETRFNSIDALRAQLEKDKAAIRLFFQSAADKTL